MAVDYKDIIRDLRNKIYKPVYFLAGKEPYYIDHITDFIEENVLDESRRHSTRPCSMASMCQ